MEHTSKKSQNIITCTPKTFIPSLHEQCEGFSDEALTIYYVVDGLSLLSICVKGNIRGVSSTTQ